MVIQGIAGTGREPSWAYAPFDEQPQPKPQLAYHFLQSSFRVAQRIFTVMLRLTWNASPRSIKKAFHEEWAFQRARRDAPPSIDSRPTFLEWIRIVWPDILTLLVIAAVALVFNAMWPTYHRLFPYADSTGRLVAPELAHPQMKPTLNTAVTAILMVGGPIFIFVVAQLWLRDFWKFNNAVFGVLIANLGGTCFQVMIKTLVGGFRPHFLAVCQPDFSREGASQGYQGIYHDWTVCTGDPVKIKNSLISFPSGHTEAAFAGFVYLSLWLNANLKIVGARHQPRVWKIVALFAPLMGAILIAGDLQMTYNHHWYDILMGAAIGTTFAFVAYACMFASVWDADTNDAVKHRRSTALKFGASPRAARQFDGGIRLNSDDGTGGESSKGRGVETGTRTNGEEAGQMV